MTFPFGHLVATWIIGKGYEKISKKKITHSGWFFLFLGGLLPDVDYLLEWFLGWQVHRTITHSFVFVILAMFLIYLILSLTNNKKERNYLTLVLGAGVFIHLLVDFFSYQGIPLFWPYLTYFSPVKIGPYLSSMSLFNEDSDLKFAILDMGIGICWIGYLWLTKRIKF